MNEATIRTIKKNENSIRKSIAAGMNTSMRTKCDYGKHGKGKGKEKEGPKSKMDSN